jgi:hypothetical protein
VSPCLRFTTIAPLVAVCWVPLVTVSRRDSVAAVKQALPQNSAGTGAAAERRGRIGQGQGLRRIGFVPDSCPWAGRPAGGVWSR